MGLWWFGNTKYTKTPFASGSRPSVPVPLFLWEKKAKSDMQGMHYCHTAARQPGASVVLLALMLCGSNGGAEETTSRTESRQTRDD